MSVVGDDSDGFRRLESRTTRLWLADDYADELAPLGLEAPGALARWCAAGEPVPGGRARGWRLVLPSGRAVHVRELAHGGLLRGLTGRRFLGLGRAIAALEGARALRSVGVPVPAPVLLHARRRGVFWQVVLANEFLPDCCAAGSFLERAPRSAVAAAARRAGEAVRRFHDAGASHRDLHVDNLLVASVQQGRNPEAEAGAGLEPRAAVTIVDLDGVRLDTSMSAAQRGRELRRLLRSLRKRALSDARRRRCVSAFLGGYAGHDTVLRDALLRSARR